MDLGVSARNRVHRIAWYRLLVALATLLLLPASSACGGGAEGGRNSASRRSPLDSAQVAVTAESVAAAEDKWNVPEAVKRLTEAGLVVVDSGEASRHPALGVEGRRLRVSRGELQLYVYDNAAQRRDDAADLDTAQAGPGALVPPGERPRFIVVNNLIAVLLTPSERLAERVQDVLTARHLGEGAGEAPGGPAP